MSYPDLPKNRLIVNGVDLTAEYGLILSDGYTLEPPEPKTYSIEIPGSNRTIDLTEALLGDVAYNNRSQEFTFYIIGTTDFEKVKTDISNLLHGKSYHYKMTMDPEYTYHGRFSVSSYSHGMFSQGKVGVITVSVDSDPFKSKGLQTFRFNAAGGIKVTLNSGRKPVCPKFEFKSETIVSAGDVYARMQPGTYTVNDLWFHQGTNEIYLNSYLGNGNVPISKYENVAISEHASKLISDLMWEGLVKAAIRVEDWVNDSIQSHFDMTIGEAEYAVDTTTEQFAVYIQYDWSDL